MLVSPVRNRRSFHSLVRLAFAAAALAVGTAPHALAQTKTYTQVIVFGDSLSDDGNVAHLVKDKTTQNYPGGDFNYSDGRFTNSSDTDPGSSTYVGVWHEQLAKRFLNLPRAVNSLDGGTDYAYGGATTEDSTTNTTVVDDPLPFGNISIDIPNMGRQVTNYLAAGPVDSGALFIVWGGGNDLFNDDSDANVTATAQRMGALITRLAQAGARTFLVPNVPPLGLVPKYNTHPTEAQALNTASASYRDQLNSVLDSTISSLAAQGISVTISRLDIYSAFLDIIANETNYNFTNVSGSAQGEDVAVNKYLFWDDIHPTTAGHSQVAQAAAKILPGGHPPFFNGEAALSGDYSYLAFANSQTFGYYSYQYFPYLYSTDLGFEYFIPGNDAANGAYLYDFALKTFLYTSPTLYPYLYNFNENAFYYYFMGTTAPRSFYDFGTGQYVYSTN